jgi:hypothetical protein
VDSILVTTCAFASQVRQQSPRPGPHHGLRLPHRTVHLSWLVPKESAEVPLVTLALVLPSATAVAQADTATQHPPTAHRAASLHSALAQAPVRIALVVAQTATCVHLVTAAARRATAAQARRTVAQVVSRLSAGVHRSRRMALVAEPMAMCVLVLLSEIAVQAAVTVVLRSRIVVVGANRSTETAISLLSCGSCQLDRPTPNARYYLLICSSLTVNTMMYFECSSSLAFYVIGYRGSDSKASDRATSGNIIIYSANYRT